MNSIDFSSLLMAFWTLATPYRLSFQYYQATEEKKADEIKQPNEKKKLPAIYWMIWLLKWELLELVMPFRTRRPRMVIRVHLFLREDGGLTKEWKIWLTKHPRSLNHLERCFPKVSDASLRCLRCIWGRWIKIKKQWKNQKWDDKFW